MRRGGRLPLGSRDTWRIPSRVTTHGSRIALEQAKTLAESLPTLMRQLMAGHDDPAAELPLAERRVCTLLCGEPLPMSALGRELGGSSSAMTQIADRLERARLVKRVAQGDDRRLSWR